MARSCASSIRIWQWATPDVVKISTVYLLISTGLPEHDQSLNA